MKKLYFIGILLSVFIMSIGCMSCGKDDDEEDGITGGTDNTMAAYFIGTWRQADVDQVWTFNADGTCVKDYSGYNHYHSEGTWHYVPDSKTLITDVDGWIWIIISTSEKQWAGTSVSGKKAYTYNRVDK